MRIIQMSVLALSLTALVGCKAINAMDNTETMKSDLAAMKATTGGMAVTTTGLRSATDELERKAAIDAGTKKLKDAEDNAEDGPPSDALMMGAKLVAEHMTSDELVKFMYLRLKLVNKTVADPAEADRSAIGGFPAKYVAKYNLRKKTRIVALQAISAQIPQPMIEKIIQEQILGGGGRFSNVATQILMLRAMFLKSFYLESGIFSEKMDNMGKLRDAFTYAKQLQFLAELPFIAKVTYVTDDGAFLPEVLPSETAPGEEGCKTSEEMASNPKCQPSLGTALSFNEKLDVNVGQVWFKQIAKKIDREIPEDIRGGSSPYAREVAEIKAECLRYSEPK